VGGEQRRLRRVVTGLHLAAGPLGHVAGQRLIGRCGVPPGVPALGMPAGETPLVLGSLLTKLPLTVTTLGVEM